MRSSKLNGGAVGALSATHLRAPSLSSSIGSVIPVRDIGEAVGRTQTLSPPEKTMSDALPEARESAAVSRRVPQIEACSLPRRVKMAAAHHSRGTSGQSPKATPLPRDVPMATAGKEDERVPRDLSEGTRRNLGLAIRGGVRGLFYLHELIALLCSRSRESGGCRQCDAKTNCFLGLIPHASSATDRSGHTGVRVRVALPSVQTARPGRRLSIPERVCPFPLASGHIGPEFITLAWRPQVVCCLFSGMANSLECAGVRSDRSPK
ncbi:hypothetical protein MTO96_049387 [Rhipicephalus appendiculatus]